MYRYYIVIYLNPYKGGMEGPDVYADSLEEAQAKADAMYPNVEVVACSYGEGA